MAWPLLLLLSENQMDSKSNLKLYGSMTEYHPSKFQAQVSKGKTISQTGGESNK